MHRLVIDVFIIWQSKIISLSYNLRVNSPFGDLRQVTREPRERRRESERPSHVLSRLASLAKKWTACSQAIFLKKSRGP